MESSPAQAARVSPAALAAVRVAGLHRRAEAGRARVLGCIMYTDRGSEYTSDEFRTEMRKLRIRKSTKHVGSCCENAAAEIGATTLEAEIRTTAQEPRELPPLALDSPLTKTMDWPMKKTGKAPITVEHKGTTGEAGTDVSPQPS
ncbi:hypothetical protein ACWC3X_38915 [Streptomyces populi]